MKYTVYHGTDASFQDMKREFLKDDLGFFFSESEDDAKGYGSNIVTCEITLDNPYVLKAIDWMNSDLSKSPWNIGVEKLKNQGYDGVIQTGDQEQYDETGEYESLYTQYCVFDPRQIRVLRQKY